MWLFRDKLEEDQEFEIVGDISDVKATAEKTNGHNENEEQEQNKEEDEGIYSIETRQVEFGKKKNLFLFSHFLNICGLLFYCLYIETCINQTLNKLESCIKWILNKITM